MSALTIASGHDRSAFFGSSDIAALLGISPYRSAVDLYLDKVDPQPQDNRNAKAKARGTRLEPYLRDMIASEFGVEIVKHNQRYVDPTVPFFAAEIDAETFDENIELKTASPFLQKQWGEEFTDEIPLAYAAQVQWALGITEKPRCRVYSLIGDDLRQYVVERDDETIVAMRTKAFDFWHFNVLARQQPEVDVNHAAIADTLRRLYPGTNGETLDATPTMDVWRTVMEEAASAEKRYAAVADGAKAHLLALMGEATAIDFGDGQAFTRKRIDRKAFTVVNEASSFVSARMGKLKGTA